MFNITACEICRAGHTGDVRPPFYPQNRYCRLCLSQRSQPVSEKIAFRGVTRELGQLMLRCLRRLCCLQSWHVLEPLQFLFQPSAASRAELSLFWNTRVELPIRTGEEGEPAWGSKTQKHLSMSHIVLSPSAYLLVQNEPKPLSCSSSKIPSVYHCESQKPITIPVFSHRYSCAGDNLTRVSSNTA